MPWTKPEGEGWRASRSSKSRCSGTPPFNVQAPDLNEEGAEVPPDLFRLNPEDSEDSAEEIASSDEGKDEESEDGEDAMPEDGADG